MKQLAAVLFALAWLGPWLTAPAQAELATEDLTGGLKPEDLVHDLIGKGITVSKVTYSGASIAAGTFRGGDGIVGFGSGVILSTGNIASVAGPNSNDSISSQNHQGGDEQLTAISGFPTQDAVILEFDFIPQRNTIWFRYVFSSDEYNEFSNAQVNDSFAFFVNGANCAIINEGPVSINTINGGNPLGRNTRNDELFINNDRDDGGAGLDTEMDGLTEVLTCEADVKGGTVNHVKLAIADASDNIYDSNVFLQAGSFSTARPAKIKRGSLTRAGLDQSPDIESEPPEEPGRIAFSGTLEPVRLGGVGHESETSGRIEVEAEVEGTVQVRVHTDYQADGTVLEANFGDGWTRHGGRPRTLHLDPAAKLSWPVRVRTGRCPKKPASESFEIIFEGLDAGTAVRTAIPLRVEVLEASWLRCWWPLLTTILGALVAGIVIHGFWSPSRFAPRLGLVLSPEEDIEEGFFHPIRAQRGGRHGFYRDARIYLAPDFRLTARSRGALLRLRADGNQVRIQPLAGNSIWRRNAEDTWDRLPPEESPARFGVVYKNELGTLFFELRNG